MVSGNNCIFHVPSFRAGTSCFAPTSPFIFLSWGLTRNMAVLCYFQRHSSSHPATKRQSSSLDRKSGWCKNEKHVCCAGLIRPSGCRGSTCDGDKKNSTPGDTFTLHAFVRMVFSEQFCFVLYRGTCGLDILSQIKISQLTSLNEFAVYACDSEKHLAFASQS